MYLKTFSTPIRGKCKSNNWWHKQLEHPVFCTINNTALKSTFIFPSISGSFLLSKQLSDADFVPSQDQGWWSLETNSPYSNALQLQFYLKRLYRLLFSYNEMVLGIRTLNVNHKWGQRFWLSICKLFKGIFVLPVFVLIVQDFKVNATSYL